MEGVMARTGEVLVLDDESIVCERLRVHLEKKGFEVETFTDSQAALERLDEKSFDVVVTDVKMKGPSGLDVMRFVRQQGKGTEVIVITGYSALEPARQAECGGAYDFVTKPFQLDAMGSLVSKAAKRARSRRHKLER
jgi:DNA-binding NtrC family response regulator